MPKDYDLHTTARTMLDAARHKRSVRAVLKKCCPHIYQQVQCLKTNRAMSDLWARCVNCDDITGQQIVAAPILRLLSELSGIALRARITPRVVHAGLQHTYGYLFSLIETPYGYKRDRWTEPDVERGMQISTPSLRATPTEGTLLTNVTWFIGQIAFRDQPQRMDTLHNHTEHVAKAIVNYPYAKLQGQRIIEKVYNVSANLSEVTIYTDLIAFPKQPKNAEAENTLLVYSIQTGKTTLPRLITAFPTTGNYAKQLMEQETKGNQVPIQLLYNGYAPGMSGKIFLGERRIV